MKAQKVFISHANSKADRAFAKSLALKLHDKGFETWNDTDITASDDWEEKLRNSLHESSAVVVLVSPNWAISPWPAFEFGTAVAIGKKLIPILITNSQWTVPPMLRSMQMIDATKVDKNQIANSIEAAINNGQA